jgi:hypothetical protein
MLKPGIRYSQQNNIQEKAATPGLLFLSGIYKSGSPLPHFSE